MADESVLIGDQRHAVLVLRLNRPEARNAFNAELMGELGASFAAAHRSRSRSTFIEPSRRRRWTASSPGGSSLLLDASDGRFGLGEEPVAREDLLQTRQSLSVADELERAGGGRR